MQSELLEFPSFTDYKEDRNKAVLKAGLNLRTLLAGVEIKAAEPEVLCGESIPESDSLMRRLITENEQLRTYFQEHGFPPVLSGTRFTIKNIIGEGNNGKVVLAEYNSDADENEEENEDDEYKDKIAEMNKGSNECILKVPKHYDGVDITFIHKVLLFEYMLQHHAYRVLKGTCTTPKPIGFLRKRSLEAANPYLYIMVAKFVPVYSGSPTTMVLETAYMKHKTCPVVGVRQWRDICLSLITAFETLQANDIYHNDLKGDNVMLYFYENNVRPVIIDFGNGCRYNSHYSHRNNDGTRSLLKSRPMAEIRRRKAHLCPNLFSSRHPHLTSDLYSVAFLIWRIAHYVELRVVGEYITNYREIPFQHRPGFKEVFERVRRSFDMEFTGIDLTGEEPRHHVRRGK